MIKQHSTNTYMINDPKLNTFLTSAIDRVVLSPPHSNNPRVEVSLGVEVQKYRAIQFYTARPNTFVTIIPVLSHTQEYVLLQMHRAKCFR